MILSTHGCDSRRAPSSRPSPRKLGEVRGSRPPRLLLPGGDYPPLDRRGCFFYSYARQASAILGVIIQCFAWGGGKATALPFETKSSFVHGTENISIFDLSKKQQEGLPSHKRHPLFRLNKCDAWKEYGRFITTENESWRHVACSGVSKPCWVGIYAPDIDFDSAKDSWRFSVIVESEFNSQNFPTPRIGGNSDVECTLKKHISTFDTRNMLCGNRCGFGGGFSWGQGLLDESQIPYKQTSLNSPDDNKPQSKKSSGVVKHPFPPSFILVTLVAFSIAALVGWGIGWVATR